MEFESQHEQKKWRAGEPCAGGGEQLQRLLEYLDGRLSREQSRSVIEHLALCEECSAVAREWAELDAQLRTQFKPQPVPTGFAERVWRAIESVPTAPGQSAPAFHADWPAAWARHRRRVLWMELPAALDQIGYTFGLMLVVLFVCRLLRVVPPALPQGVQASPWQTPFWLGVTLSGMVLAGVLGFIAKRPLVRLLARL